MTDYKKYGLLKKVVIHKSYLAPNKVTLIFENGSITVELACYFDDHVLKVTEAV